LFLKTSFYMHACNYAQVAEYITFFWKIVHIQVKFNIHAHACIYTATVVFDLCIVDTVLH